MKRFDIFTAINTTIQTIFDCGFQESISDTVAIIEYVEKEIDFCSTEHKDTWSQILQYIDLGLQNKDYLVIADILKYELNPLLKSQGLTEEI